jgi:hypothetical protein
MIDSSAFEAPQAPSSANTVAIGKEEAATCGAQHTTAVSDGHEEAAAAAVAAAEEAMAAVTLEHIAPSAVATAEPSGHDHGEGDTEKERLSLSEKAKRRASASLEVFSLAVPKTATAPKEEMIPEGDQQQLDQQRIPTKQQAHSFSPPPPLVREKSEVFDTSSVVVYQDDDTNIPVARSGWMSRKSE